MSGKEIFCEQELLGGRTLLIPYGCYQLANETPGYKTHVGFSVREDERQWPNFEFDEQALLNEQSYSFLHGFSLALTLAAIRSRLFPGMECRGIAYPFEYAARRGDELFNGSVLRMVERQIPDGKESHWIEIGGQGGRWSSSLASDFIAKRNTLVELDIFDLDLLRRGSLDFPISIYEEDEFRVRYIQADAHKLDTYAERLDLPKYDVALLMNLTDVLYDPFSIFFQLWQQLKPGGVLIIGESYGAVELPLWGEGNKERLQELAVGGRDDRDFGKLYQLWRQQEQKMLATFPKGDFFYDSSSPNADYASISRALYELPSYLPRFSFSRVLKALGFKADLIGGRRAWAYAVIKDKEENPFELPILGIGRRYFHVNEYVFPQVFRVFRV